MGFSGQGNPSDRVPVTITVANNRIRVALGDFDSSQGQTLWVIFVNKISERANERPDLWKFNETTTPPHPVILSAGVGTTERLTSDLPPRP